MDAFSLHMSVRGLHAPAALTSSERVPDSGMSFSADDAVLTAVHLVVPHTSWRCCKAPCFWPAACSRVHMQQQQQKQQNRLCQLACPAKGQSLHWHTRCVPACLFLLCCKHKCSLCLCHTSTTDVQPRLHICSSLVSSSLAFAAQLI
jgi:hypothetical protein